MTEAYMVEIILGCIAFLAAAGWAQTNYRISQKVNCDVCGEREKTTESKLHAIDERHYRLLERISDAQKLNKEDHVELKMGVKNITNNNLETKVELAKISSCLDKLYKEMKDLKD